jgi:hypothetical protein
VPVGVTHTEREPALRHRGPGFVRALVLLSLGAFLVRAAFLLLEPATGPVADERMWVVWGADVLPSPEVAFSPLRFRLIFHPPLYPYFIGAVSHAFGTLEAVKWAQVVLTPLLVPAVGLLGRRALGDQTGLLAAAFAAFYPELVWFSTHFWVEGLFIVVLWWALERLVAADEQATVATALVAGALFGLSILARETALYFLPVAALWLGWKRPNGLVRAGALMLAAVLVVAPWTWRNFIVYEAFVPVSTAGALNLWQGNTALSRAEVYEQYWAIKGRIEKYRFARQKGIEAILERQPAWFFEKLRDEMPSFWEADGQALVHVRRGAYGEVSSRAALVASAIVVLPYLALLALFVLGVAVMPLSRAPLMLAAFLVYYVLLHVVTHGYARYRLPALPAIMLLGALGARALGTRPSVSGPRKAVAAAVGLVLLLSLVPSLRLLRDHRARGGPDPGDRATEEPTDQ